MKLSKASKKALEIIAANPGIGITEFARQMWPDSEKWKTPNSTGKCKGYGIIRAGQSYLSRLLINTDWITEKFYYTGLSKKDRKFYITDSGKAQIRLTPGSSGRGLGESEAEQLDLLAAPLNPVS